MTVDEDAVEAAIEEWIEGQTEESASKRKLQRHLRREFRNAEVELKSGTDSADIIIDDDIGIKVVTDLNKYKTGNVGRQFKLHAERHDFLVVLGDLADTDQNTWSYLKSHYDARSLGLERIVYLATLGRKGSPNTTDGGAERPSLNPAPAAIATLVLVVLILVVVIVVL